MMKPLDRVARLNCAVVSLTWCTDPIPANPRGRCAEALVLLADTDAATTIGSGGGDGLGIRSKGSHSDPTALAATQRIDTVIRPRSGTRAQANKITSAVSDLGETTAMLRSVCGSEVAAGHHRPLGLVLADLEWCLTVPHSIGAWHTDHDETRAEVDHACRFVDEQATTLASMVNAVLLDNLARRPAAVEQPTLRTCTCCTPMGYAELATRFGLCIVCDEFRREHKCLPTKQIRDDRAMGRKRVRPGQLSEAKAQRNRKTRRSA